MLRSQRSALGLAGSALIASAVPHGDRATFRRSVGPTAVAFSHPFSLSRMLTGVVVLTIAVYV